ncbi:MAG TPA: 12,18-didecarboxysiroheme deacetylase [Coriobacteriia bacterium]|nr:12,18-didecarboxysiroheme deacetylase [Coriobacteriia bacterium]
MIGISKLYCGAVEPADVLRYNRMSKDLPSEMLQFARDKKPVVVWNCTQTCNLKCVHCYAGSENKKYEGEMTTEDAKKMIDDLAAFGAPVLLFSGGEPTVRPDLLELMHYAKSKGMRVVISTNGTLITAERAKEFAEVGLSYVGVSLDGGRETHDKFRGIEGSFDKSIEGIRNSKAAGIKVGLRMTINKRNYQDIDEIFEIMDREDINRACFYHLVYTGRGSELMNEDLDHEQTREVVRHLMDLTKARFDAGKKPEILTVDNHADAPFVYMELLKEDPKRAAEVMQLLEWNQGNSSGNGIACVSWDGEVYPDQFWRHFSLGNVKDRPFSEIWTDVSRETPQSELMFRLKDKRPFVKGRCADCRWLNICGGNFRVRSEAATGDLWGADPACYLTDEEITGDPVGKVEPAKAE